MDAAAAVIVPIITIPYIVLAFAVAGIAKHLESKLILTGLLTSVLAVAYGALLGSVGAQAGDLTASVSVGGSTLPGSLMKLGVILVLSGVGLAAWSRCESPGGRVEERS